MLETRQSAQIHRPLLIINFFLKLLHDTRLQRSWPLEKVSLSPKDLTLYTRPLMVIWTDMGLVRVRINPLMKTWNFHDPRGVVHSRLVSPPKKRVCNLLLMHCGRQRNDKLPRSCISPLQIFILLEYAAFFVDIFFMREQSSQVTCFQGTFLSISKNLTLWPWPWLLT